MTKEISDAEKNKIWEYISIGLTPPEIKRLTNASRSEITEIQEEFTSKANMSNQVPVLVQEIKPRKRSKRNTIPENLESEIATRHLNGEGYDKIAKSLKMNPVTVREHGRKYLKSLAQPKQAKPAYSNKNPLNEKYMQELREWIKANKNPYDFIRKYRLSQKTRPTNSTIYGWFKQITGVSYSIAKTKMTFLNTSTARTAKRNKTVKEIPHEEIKVESKNIDYAKEIKRLEHRIHELKENKRLKEAEKYAELQKQVEELENEARFE